MTLDEFITSQEPLLKTIVEDSLKLSDEQYQNFVCEQLCRIEGLNDKFAILLCKGVMELIRTYREGDSQGKQT